MGNSARVTASEAVSVSAHVDALAYSENTARISASKTPN